MAIFSKDGSYYKMISMLKLVEIWTYTSDHLQNCCNLKDATGENENIDEDPYMCLGFCA
jgi:hypothetical protein